MHPRIAEALEYLDTERAELRAAVELVPPALREQPPGPDRWSVAQVLQHLTLIENRIARLVSKRIAGARAEGLGPELETGPILNTRHAAKIADRSFRVTAPEEIRPPSDADAASAWAALEQSRETLRAAALSGDGLALGEVMHPHPVLGEINLYQWILFVGSHEVRHTAQVREIADQLRASSTTATGAS
jgi:uncharacterized damage-inducible protein DinB